MARLNESSIRDYLMQRLDLVEPGLVPVAREHYLKNYQGASGFLDILARDSNSRLVIIELKRTDAAAREALQELFKYAALLRSNYLVRNVDYRLIVLALEWHELLVPYSEFVKQVSYEVSAGKIILDDEGVPLRIEPVTPVPTASQRKFAKRHFLWRFQNEEYANSAAAKLAAHMDKAGLRDFVLVKTRSTDPHISNKSFLYFAQQELPLSEYQSLIREQLGDEEYGEYLDCISALIEEEDCIGESADQVWLPGYDILYGSLNCETSEISHPEKAAHWFAEGAQRDIHVLRYGRFTTEEISDETIIEEIIGHGGGSDIHLDIEARTESPPQMEALHTAVDNVFFFNSSWRGALKDFLSYAQRTGPATITLKAFCNDDILRAIAGVAFGYPGFVSTFRLEIDRPVGQKERFLGLQEWDSSEIDFADIIKNYFEGDPFCYLMACHFGEHRTLNQDIMYELGLTNIVCRESGSQLEKIRIQGSAVIAYPQPMKGSITCLVDRNVDEVKKIVELFMTHDQGFINIITDWVNHYESG